MITLYDHNMVRMHDLSRPSAFGVQRHANAIKPLIEWMENTRDWFICGLY